MRLSPGKRGRQATIAALYGAIVAQARRPEFYVDYGVSDTAEGRLEMILVHLILFTRRWSRNLDTSVGQDVFARFCQDMDDNLREMGVGDLAVPKRVRAIVEAYLGRSQVYDDALARDDGAALAAALLRNVYDGRPERQAEAARLASYIERAAQGLAAADDSALLRGDIAFADPAIKSQGPIAPARAQ